MRALPPFLQDVAALVTHRPELECTTRRPDARPACEVCRHRRLCRAAATSHALGRDTVATSRSKATYDQGHLNTMRLLNMTTTYISTPFLHSKMQSTVAALGECLPQTLVPRQQRLNDMPCSAFHGQLQTKIRARLRMMFRNEEKVGRGEKMEVTQKSE